MTTRPAWPPTARCGACSAGCAPRWTRRNRETPPHRGRWPDIRRFLSILAFTVLAPAPAPALARTPACSAGKTVLTTQRVRVFTAFVRGFDGTYACRRPGGPVVRLGEDTDYGTSSGGTTVHDVLASGPFVAASVDCRSSDGANEVVSVWDLRGRPHPIKRASSDGNWLCVAGGRSSGIGAFVLSRWGSIAWTAVILDCSAASCAPASTVWRWDALSPIQVEAGPGRVSDLRLDGIRLTWVRDGVPGSTAFDAYRTPDQRYP